MSKVFVGIVRYRVATLDDLPRLARLRWEFRTEDQDLEMLLVWPSERSQAFYARAGFGPDDEIRVLRLRDYDAPARPPLS